MKDSEDQMRAVSWEAMAPKRDKLELGRVLMAEVFDFGNNKSYFSLEMLLMASWSEQLVWRIST